MTSPPLPDVLFLRPRQETTEAVEPAQPSAQAPARKPTDPQKSDVVFAAASQQDETDKTITVTIPNPHTRFQSRHPSVETTPPVGNETRATGTSTHPIKHTEAVVPEQNLLEPELEIPTAAIAPVPVGKEPSERLAEPAGIAEPIPSTHVPIRQSVDPSWMVQEFQWNPIVDKIIHSNATALATLFQDFAKSLKASTEIHAADHPKSVPTTVLGVAGLGTAVGSTTLSQLCVQLLDETISQQESDPFAETRLPSLLLDCSLWTPSIANQIGLRCRRCWLDLKPHDNFGDAVIANAANEIHVMPLNGALQSDLIDSPAALPSGISYTIPAAGLDGVLQRLNDVLTFARQSYRCIILDLGDIDAWLSRHGLQQIASQLSNLLIVNRPPIDRRAFSHVYWDLDRVGIRNIHLIENTPLS